MSKGHYETRGRELKKPTLPHSRVLQSELAMKHPKVAELTGDARDIADEIIEMFPRVVIVPSGSSRITLAAEIIESEVEDRLAKIPDKERREEMTQALVVGTYAAKHALRASRSSKNRKRQL